MKRIAVILLLLMLALPILAKSDKIKKLTDAEIADVNEVITSLPVDKTVIEKIWKSKDFKNTNVRCADQATKFKAWQTKVEAGEIKCKKRVDGEYVEFTATMADVSNITDTLDRWFHSDPNCLESILMKERCPLDEHMVRYGRSDPNE